MTGAPAAGRPLRVAYISTTSEPGGAEISLATLIKGLDRREVEPRALLPGPGPLAEKLRALDVPVSFVPMETRRRRRPLGFWRSQRAIGNWLRQQGPDLVHVNSFWAPELVIPAARRAGFPVVYHCRDLYDRLDPARASALRMCSAVIAITRCVAQRLEALLPGLPVKVIYNDVDQAELEAAAPDSSLRPSLGWEECFVVGIASRISPDKGQLDFIRAAAIVSECCPSARFLVVGSPLFTHDRGYPARLDSEILSLGLQGRVHFTGFVESVASVYKTMDVCVLASRSEPFGLVVVEAMACGIPVVATRSGGPEEVIRHGETGLLVDVERPDQMAEAIIRLMEDAGLRARLAAAGREDVARRFRNQESRRVTEMYRGLLGDV